MNTRKTAAGLLAAVLAVSGGGALAGEMRIRGIIEPVAKAKLPAEISAPVIRLPFKDGEAFRKGDVLAAFDCRRFKSIWKAARAAWRARDLEARGKKRLVKYQAAGKLEAAIKAAESEKARAEAEAAGLRVEKCILRAPYDGRVVERHVQRYEAPQPGKPLISIVGTGRLEVEMIAPSDWLAWIRPGAAFVFHVDETGARLTGKVARIGAVVDAVSQTVRLRGVLDDPPENILPGMSGSAEFSMPGEAAGDASGGGS